MGEIITLKLKRGQACKHINVIVDESARIIECENCGAQVDPFDAMLNIAYAREQNEWHFEAAKKYYEKEEKKYKTWKLCRAKQKCPLLKIAEQESAD